MPSLIAIPGTKFMAFDSECFCFFQQNFTDSQLSAAD